MIFLFKQYGKERVFEIVVEQTRKMMLEVNGDAYPASKKNDHINVP